MSGAGQGTPPGELALEGVEVRYEGALALEALTVSLRPRSVTAVLGPNGAGKSTLAAAATGFVRPSAGRILLDGVDITDRPAWARARGGIHYLPERSGTFPSLSVQDNLRMAFRGLGSRRAVARAVAEAEDLFPALARRRRQPAGVLSGGEQQMLALARVLVEPSQVVVIDELSHGLAPAVLDVLFGRLAERRGSMTLLLIEQYLGRALDLADEVVVLVRGEVRHHGPAAGLSVAEVERFYEVGDGEEPVDKAISI